MDALSHDLMYIVIDLLTPITMLSLLQTNHEKRDLVQRFLLETHWPLRIEYYRSFCTVDEKCVAKLAVRDFIVLSMGPASWGGWSVSQNWIKGRRCQKFYTEPLHSWGEWSLPNTCCALTKKKRPCTRKVRNCPRCWQHTVAGATEDKWYIQIFFSG